MKRKYLTDTEFLKYIKNHIEMFISTNIENTTSTDRPPMDIIWDTFKVYMRGITI